MKHVFKNASFFLILSFLFFLIPATTTIAKSKLKVVYTDWFPYTYLEDGKAMGFEIEIFKAVINQMGLEAEFTQYPWKRCLANLESGRADVLISLLKTPEREMYTHYPDENISSSRTVFFTKTDSNIKYNGSLDGFKSLSIGFIMGFSYGDQFDNAGYLIKDPAINPKILIRKLLAGRNDVAADNQTVIEGYASKMGVMKEIRFLFPPIHNQKLYVGFSKSRSLKLCNDFSKALGNFKKSYPYISILAKYGVLTSQQIMKFN